MRVYIATEKSKKIIRDARKAEKKGDVIDWDNILNESHNARATTKEQQLATAGGWK